KQSENSLQNEDDVGQVINKKISAIKQITDDNHSLANATDEQNQVVKSLHSYIHVISDISLQGQSNLNLNFEECTKLKHQFSDLERMGKKFKV
ncbi:methyl-accepting chemotaxis protein, partial [Pseudoalteromonas sp. S3173]